MAARKKKKARKGASKRNPAAKKASRKAASRRPTAKKATAKKATARKAAAKRTATKKPAAKRAAAPRRRSPETLRFRSVSAGLTVGDIQKSLAWYRDVAGFHVGELWRNDGVVRGGEVLAGAARFYLGQDDWAKGRDRKKGEGMRLHLATAQSVDEIAAGIKQRGGKLDSEPENMPWGARAFTLTDPDGFKLTISSGD